MIIKFADLFSGIGGFRLGLEKIGWKCVYSGDIDTYCEKTYQVNFNTYFDSYDIWKMKKGALKDIDVICAGFPCQPFSIAGKRNGLKDSRGQVFYKLLDVIKDSNPNIIFFENVPYLLKHDRGKTFQNMINSIKEYGYSIYYELLDSSDFGVPQFRKRIFIVGFKDELRIADFIFTKKRENNKPFRLCINKGDYSIPISRKWEYYIDLYQNKISLSDIPFKIPKTRTKLERKDPDVDLEDCVFQMRSSGIRANSIDRPLPTFAVSISGGGAMIPVYSKERRHLNLIEIKRMMGFPDEYKFPVPRTYAIKQLANAVCPPVISSIGLDIENAIK